MKQREDRLPKWVSFSIVVSVIIAVMAVGYYFNHTAPPKATAIGDDRRMIETLDKKADQGSWSPTIQTKDELKSGTIIVSDNGSTKTTGVFANGTSR